MGKYQKKPVVIEAFQWFGDERQTEDPEWIVEAIKNGDAEITYKDAYREVHDKLILNIFTLEGMMTAKQGDYIIKGVHGELYPCKPDIFKETYEEFKEK